MLSHNFSDIVIFLCQDKESVLFFKKIMCAIVLASWGVSAVLAHEGTSANATLTSPASLVLASQEKAAQGLEKEGVLLIHYGDQYRIILHSDSLFKPQSANIRRSQLPLLKSLAAFINLFSPLSLSVSAYVDANNRAFFNRILTVGQANAVQHALSSYGVTARLFYAQGMAAASPVATNRESRGRYLNRRIEIVFRYASGGLYGF